MMIPNKQIFINYFNPDGSINDNITWSNVKRSHFDVAYYRVPIRTIRLTTELCKEIRNKRLAKGWSRKELANYAKVYLYYVARVENKAGKTSAEKLNKILTALEIKT